MQNELEFIRTAGEAFSLQPGASTLASKAQQSGLLLALSHDPGSIASSVQEITGRVIKTLLTPASKM